MSRVIPLICVAALVTSVTAHAQIKARVVVVPFVAGDGASETATSKFQNLLVDELKSRGDVLELVPAPQTRPLIPVAATPSGASARKTPSPEAVSALDSGRKAFDDLRFEDAVTNLRKGIDAMLSDPATADYDNVLDAYVKLAAASFRMGEEKDAKAALLDLARFAPGYALPPGFPPVFQREFEKAKKRLEKQPKGTVSIDGPPGSTAFVDGRDLGMVPVLEENVPAGTHYVKVEGGKGERYGQTVNVTAGTVKVKGSFANGGQREVTTQKAGVADPAIASTVDSETLARLQSYAKAANADYALVGYVYKTSDTQLTAGTAIFSARKTGFSALTPVSFDTDVLTANTEAFKLSDELVKRLMSFGSLAALPLNLASRQARAGTSSVARNDRPTSVNGDNLDAVGPSRQKVVLVPRPNQTGPVPEVIDSEPLPPESKPGLSTGAVVAIVIGSVVVVGAATTLGVMVGTRSEPWRPVSGTVTASW